MACNQDHFDDTWAAFDKTATTTKTYRTPRKALDDLIACEIEHGYTAPFGVTNPSEYLKSKLLAAKPRADAATYEVYRDRMWEFLRDHKY